VSEIAEKLGKSKTSVYKKANLLKIDLKVHKKKLNGVIHYTAEGFDIIRNSYTTSINETSVDNNIETKVNDKYLDLLISEKDEQIIHLKKQLEEKNNALEKALDLANQTQHLLAIEKQHILQLQEPPIKKSFWDRFKKKQPNESWDMDSN
jgi:DNA-binding transcriptional regulator GbsR (MarR family)